MRYQRLKWAAVIATLATVLQPSLPSLAAREASLPDAEIQQLRQEIQVLQNQVSGLEAEINSLQSEISSFNSREPSAIGLTVLLTGAFCTLWAQNTRRNPWLCFFAGVFFNFIILIVLLVKNSPTARE